MLSHLLPNKHSFYLQIAVSVLFFSQVSCEQKSNQLIGSWELLEWTATSNSKKNLQPYGENPFGRLIIGSNDELHLFLTKNDRNALSTEDPSKRDPVEVLEAFNSSFSYTATYENLLSEKQLSIEILNCSVPNWLGKKQYRDYEVRGDTLILSSPQVRTSIEGGSALNHRLVWLKK